MGSFIARRAARLLQLQGIADGKLSHCKTDTPCYVLSFHSDLSAFYILWSVLIAKRRQQ